MIVRMTYICLAIALCTVAAQVKLGETLVSGRYIQELQQEFYGGIPFAEPPVGQLRLQPPIIKLTLDTSFFEAKEHGPGCIQPSGDVASYSEDCLTLNILRPSTIHAGAALPVMVWFYGGGFLAASSADYDGSPIVAHSVSRGTPIIYVSFNYRIGPFGFPQGVEAVDKSVLNLGLKDQLAALEWVQVNIGAFGGDRNKVTVFGISAGAVSIAIHMLRPDFTKYARAAILQSGFASTPFIVGHGSVRDPLFASFVQGIAACAHSHSSGNAIDCLRSTNFSVAELVAATSAALVSTGEQYPFVPTIDGEGGVYPIIGSKVLRSGNHSRLPFIAGTTLDEGTVFSAPFVGPNSLNEWLIANFTPSMLHPSGQLGLVRAVKTLLRLYPDSLGSPYKAGLGCFGLHSAYKRISAILGDILFDSQRRMLQRLAARHNISSYGYLFTDPQPGIPAMYGVAHAQDKSYVYGKCSTFRLESQVLCERMIHYWISFATSLTPNDRNGISRPHWEQYGPRNEVLLQLDGDNTTLISDGYREQQIAFINAKSLIFHH